MACADDGRHRLPFRRIVKRYGAGLTVTEMIASQAMIRETRQSLAEGGLGPVEEPVSMQLAGCRPRKWRRRASSTSSAARRSSTSTWAAR
jgi:tRNA-dihydrouridine synthase